MTRPDRHACPLIIPIPAAAQPASAALAPHQCRSLLCGLGQLHPDALDRTISAWLAGQQPPPPASRPPPRRAVAVDGKTLRGSGHHKDAPVHLLAATDHTTGAVLAQTDVAAATNEITQFQPLLQRLDLTASIITADALHTQREHAE